MSLELHGQLEEGSKYILMLNVRIVILFIVILSVFFGIKLNNSVFLEIKSQQRTKMAAAGNSAG